MPRLTRSQRLLLCTAAAAVLFLFRLGGPALWEPDEGRYAEVARAMVASGDYVTPRDNGVRYFEKPPLVYWASAASISLFGRDEFAVRLPAALASIGSVTATAAAGELMLGPAAGMLAGLALALSPLFFLFARVATPDPELAVFFSAALFAFYLAAMRGFARGTGRLLMALAAAMLAFATLAKGPVAPLLAGAIGMGWLVVERRARDALRIRWLECIAIYLLITVPWFVLVARRNPGFVEFFLVHEHLHRFVSDTEHGWGPWFFIPVAIAGTWPFFYFIPAGISDLYNSPDRARQSAVHFLAIWFLIILIFFSIPRAKLAEYLLPGLPPLAVLAAAGLERVRKMAPEGARRHLRRFAGLNAMAGLLGVGTFAILRRGDPAIAADVLLIALPIGAVALAAWIFVPSRRMVVATATTFAALIAIGIAKTRIDATPQYSYRELARLVVPQLDAGCVLASYHHFEQAIPFYTQHQERLVGYRGELAPFGDSPDAASTFIPTDLRLREAWAAPGCVVLIANRADQPKLSRLLQPAPVVIGGEGKKVALINRAPDVTSPAREEANVRPDRSRDALPILGKH